MAEPAEALEVLREVWSAQGQGGADLDEALGHHGHGGRGGRTPDLLPDAPGIRILAGPCC